MHKRLTTAESVRPGHPDKICDQIADAILDAHLLQDPSARCAVEVAVAGEEVWVFGEHALTGEVDVERIARQVLRDIGYDIATGISPDTCEVRVSLTRQSPDIAQALTGKRQGAGDQGIIYGFATREHRSYLPTAAFLAHHVLRKVSSAPELAGYLRPDGKAQVTLIGDPAEPVLHNLVISLQHEPADMDVLRWHVRAIALRALEEEGVDIANAPVLINPSGRFLLGGPRADSGLTGRKLAVDTYGGLARHGGGAFSGKDASKMDRAAAYAARHAAKNIVAARLARRAEVALAYAIGVADPVAVEVNTYGTGVLADDALAHLIQGLWDFSPQGIRDRFRLTEPTYRRTATWGHFTRPDLPWELLDSAEALRGLAG
ncbi:MetK S-adenosylmethionine synthetase [uncultured Caudovirales phage]|uniref:methionine adenosyltransferase n=1 Tax=uncultured Caudovirales phage TaxID=2100421 RepID=A0A6J5N4R5_9CAUD|nr:MetK S-adenosylmethionine synthetase [uncultured Caudovirales phage]